MSMNELYHHGIKGMHWGIRRFQNPDGSLTPAGKARMDRYRSKEIGKAQSSINKMTSSYDKERRDVVEEYGENSKDVRKFEEYYKDELDSYRDRISSLKNMSYEKMYKDMTKQRRQKVKDFVSTAVLVGGTGLLLAAYSGVFRSSPKYAAQKIIEQTYGISDMSEKIIQELFP